MNILEIEATHKNKGTLEYIKELRMGHVYQTIATDVVKSTIVLFLSEVLHHSIHEEEKNERIFSFLETAFLWLDEHSEVSNFHLIFLLEFTKFLGFYPNLREDNFNYFEVTEGVFTPFQGISCLSEHETMLLKKLLQLKFDHTHKLFSVAERQVLLKILLDYYAIHLDGFKRPKSVDVLKEVFA